MLVLVNASSDGVLSGVFAHAQSCGSVEHSVVCCFQDTTSMHCSLKYHLGVWVAEVSVGLVACFVLSKIPGDGFNFPCCSCLELLVFESLAAVVCLLYSMA
jgi:hypothetical protein